MGYSETNTRLFPTIFILIFGFSETARETRAKVLNNLNALRFREVRIRIQSIEEFLLLRLVNNEIIRVEMDVLY